MKVTIITVILGFCYCRCYVSAYPSRCVCVQNPEVSRSILTRFLPYDQEQVQGQLDDPKILGPEKTQPSPYRLTTGSLSKLGPRYRKKHINIQKPKRTEYELGEYSDTGKKFKQDNILRALLELLELPKGGNPENGTPILRTGQLSRNIAARLRKKADIRLSQDPEEYITEPKHTEDARDGDYEYAL